MIIQLKRGIFMYNLQTTVDRVNGLLLAHGREKQALNDYCGISKNTINQSVDSRYGLGATILYSIGEYFDCSVDYLLGRTDIQTTGGGLDVSQIEERLLSAFRSMSRDEQLMLIGRAEHIAEQEKTVLPAAQ